MMNQSSLEAFANGVLGAFGESAVTDENKLFVEAWAARENTNARNNALATTWKLPNSSQFNSVGVQNYSTLTDGIHATVQTMLQQNYYPHLIPAFQTGNIWEHRDEIRGDLRTWSGGGYDTIDHPSERPDPVTTIQISTEIVKNGDGTTTAPNNAVASVQALLNGRHRIITAVDGVFGPRTEASVRSFQSSHSLSVDGIVGPQTWEALLLH